MASMGQHKVDFRRVRLVIASAILGMGGATASAAPIGLVGEISNRYTDNATLVSSGEVDDVESVVSLGINYQSDPDVCNVLTAGELGYSRWEKDSFDPEFRADLDFVGDCQVTDRLAWQLSDSVRTIQVDTRLAETPDNNTRKNVFQTGPVYVLRLGQLDRLQLSGQYERTDYSEDTEPDGDRFSGTAWFSRDFTPNLNAGIQYFRESAELDTTEEIDRTSLSLTLSQRWNTSTLEGSLGYMNFESRQFGQTFETDGLVGDIRYEREITASSIFYLSANRDITDQTSDFDVLIDDVVFNFRNSTGVEVISVRAGLRNTFSIRSELDLAIYADKSDYFQSNEKDRTIGIVGNYLRPISPRMDGFLTGRLEQLSYDPDDRDDTILDLELGLSYNLLRKLRVVGGYGYSQRTSDLESAEYEENWIRLGLNYEFR